MSEELILYHGVQGERENGFRLGGLETHPQGIHLGTLEQARMRAGRGDVVKVSLSLDQINRRIQRVRDQDGSWRTLLKRHARQGRKVLVYLNRYEGIGLESASTLAQTADPSRLNDRVFQRLAPEACDSYVVLDPDLVQIKDWLPSTRAAQSA